jgi:hypothetical protein
LQMKRKYVDMISKAWVANEAEKRDPKEKTRSVEVREGADVVGVKVYIPSYGYRKLIVVSCSAFWAGNM